MSGSGGERTETGEAGEGEAVEMEPDPYLSIAGHVPNEVRLGASLITMVEPHVGFERRYNRWYEDDHFYSGAMVGPWVFSGRRWVATRDLQRLRYPENSPIATPVTSGCYLATYWHLAGHGDAVTRWSQAVVSEHLYPQGRGFNERTHVYTAFSTFAFGVVRDADGPMRPEHALDHSFPGLVLEIIDPGPTDSRQAMAGWLEAEFAPRELAGSPSAQCLGFFPTPGLLPPGVPGAPEPPNLARLITLLWFLDVDPRQCWSAFLSHGQTLAEHGAELLLAAPFVPTLPGTDTYVDELH